MVVVWVERTLRWTIFLGGLAMVKTTMFLKEADLTTRFALVCLGVLLVLVGTILIVKSRKQVKGKQ